MAPRREDNVSNISGTAVLDRPADDAGAPTQDTGDTPSGGAPSTNGLTDGTQASGDGTQTQTGGGTNSAAATPTKRAPKRNPDDLGPEEVISINVRLPNALRKLMAATAVEQKTSVPQLLASMVATAYEFDLPKPKHAARTKKYDTPDQRKEAQKAAQKKQRLITQAVLQAVEEGKISLDVDALVAEILAKQAADAATDTAAAPATESTPAGVGAS